MLPTLSNFFVLEYFDFEHHCLWAWYQRKIQRSKKDKQENKKRLQNIIHCKVVTGFLFLKNPLTNTCPRPRGETREIAGDKGGENLTLFETIKWLFPFISAPVAVKWRLQISSCRKFNNQLLRLWWISTFVGNQGYSN